MNDLVRTCTLLIGMAIGCQSASAQIILNFSQTPTGGVQVVGTGSGTTTGFGWSRNWQFLDFDNDFLSDSIGHTNPIVADTVSGQITNSWGFSRQIDRFRVNRSAGSNDDVSFRTNANMFFWINQPYTFTMTAIFNSSTLSYSDLIPGTYVDNTVSGGTEIFGPTTIVIAAVPESSSLGVVTVGVGVLILFDIRRVRSDQVLNCAQKLISKQSINQGRDLFQTTNH